MTRSALSYRFSRPCLTAVLLLATLPSAARAQESAAPEPTPVFALQLQDMLQSGRTLSDTLDDAVYDLAASPGRRILQLPLSLEQGELLREPTTWGEPALDVPAARFVGWYLPDPAAATTAAGQAAADAGPSDAQLRRLDLLLTLPQAEPFAPPVAAESSVDRRPPAVPAGAPRLAREIVLLPPNAAAPWSDGKSRVGVAWEIARVVPGTAVKTGELPYLLYVDGNRLRDLQPPRPERLDRTDGESTRDYTLRRRQADLDYRKLTDDYRELVDLVRGLPTRFEDALPEVVWAVYEVNAASPGFTVRGQVRGQLQGPGQDWNVSFADWEQLSAMAGGTSSGGTTVSFAASGGNPGGGGGGGWTGEQLRQLGRLNQLTADQTPWNQRALAVAVTRSGLASGAQRNGPAAKLLATLLKSPDELTRNRVIYHLATLRPTTPTLAEILRNASDAQPDDVDAALAIAALRVELAVALQPAGAANAPLAAGGGGGIDAALTTVNTQLASPRGLPPQRILRELVAAVTAGNTGRGSQPVPADMQTALIAGLRLDRLPPDRLDGAIAGVIQTAAVDPALAGGWLDRQLLASTQPDVPRRTLKLLAQAGAPAPTVGPVARGLLSLVFSPPTIPASASAPAPGVGVGDPSDQTLDLTLTAGLPLDSANHSLFKFLNAGDADLRKLGWAALRHFELSVPTTGAAPADGQPDLLEQIVSAGLSRPQTPASLVEFLRRQPDAARTTAPLMRVGIRGDYPAAREAGRALLGSGRAMGPVFAALDPDDRDRWGGRLYDTLGGGWTPVVGLLRAQQGTAAQIPAWFAQQVSDHKQLPPPAAFGEQVGSVEDLCQLVTGPDIALANGALAALTAMAGGDLAMQHRMIERFKTQRTTLGTPEMVEAWTAARQDLYTQKLQAAAGRFRVTVMIHGSAAGGSEIASNPILGDDPEVLARQQAAAASGQVQRVVLGAIELKADGRSVVLGSGVPTVTVPDDRLAIRLPSPAELLTFNIPELKGLPLDKDTPPLDLLPKPQGVWQGEVTLSDGRRFEMLFEPLAAPPKATTTPPAPTPARAPTPAPTTPAK